MKRCMADLTRLLALLHHLRRHPLQHPDMAGLSHPRDTHLITDTRAPHATSARPAWRPLAVAGMAGLLCLGLLAVMPPSAEARQSRYVDEVPTHQGGAEAAVGQTTPSVALTALPRQAQDVYQRILAGGPFRYEKDGVVFGNRERLLPRQPRGFYREYTVPTPGERDRGARRIVCGGKEVRQPETCFYSGDHYASFQTIDPRR